MNRNWLNFTIDGVTFLAVTSLAATGLLMEWVLPPGSHGATVWGISRHGWGDVHFWISMTVIGLLAVHLVLHWQWVCTMGARLCYGPGGAPSPAKRHAAGLVTLLVLVALIGGFLLAAWWSVEPGERPGRPPFDGGAVGAERAVEREHPKDDSYHNDQARMTNSAAVWNSTGIGHWSLGFGH